MKKRHAQRLQIIEYSTSVIRNLTPTANRTYNIVLTSKLPNCKRGYHIAIETVFPNHIQAGPNQYSVH